MIGLARGRSTNTVSTSVSEVQRRAPPAGTGREGRGRRGAPPRGGAGKTLHFLHGEWGRRLARRTSRTFSELGRCLTVARGFDRPQRAGRSWVLEPRRRSSGLAIEARWLGSRRRTESGHEPWRRTSTWETEPGIVLEQALEGKMPRRAPTRRLRPGQGLGSQANGLPRGAKLRSGRPGC